MGERRPAIIIAGCLAVLACLAAAWILVPAGGEQVPEAIDLQEVTESAEIQSHVELSHISIATSTNYVGHKIYLIHGVLKNVSTKPLRAVEARMTFTDFEGKPVDESVQQVFEAKQRPLLPGAEYRFESGFENLPKTWNYRVPVIELVKVSY